MSGGGTRAFLALEGFLYAGFLLLDFSGQGRGWSVALKYASILLCVAFAWTRARDGDGRLVGAALVGTAAADLCLLVLDRWYLAGVAAFCAVQCLYWVRILRLRRWRGWRGSLICRVGLILAVGGLLALLGALEPLTAAAAVYVSQLAANTAESFSQRDRSFSLGLLLFLCCDLCVGLHNLPEFLPGVGGGGLFAFAAVGMWLFYLPSQVLITLSIGKE